MSQTATSTGPSAAVLADIAASGAALALEDHWATLRAPNPVPFLLSTANLVTLVSDLPPGPAHFVLRDSELERVAQTPMSAHAPAKRECDWLHCAVTSLTRFHTGSRVASPGVSATDTDALQQAAAGAGLSLQVAQDHGAIVDTGEHHLQCSGEASGWRLSLPLVYEPVAAQDIQVAGLALFVLQAGARLRLARLQLRRSQSLLWVFAEVWGPDPIDAWSLKHSARALATVFDSCVGEIDALLQDADLAGHYLRQWQKSLRIH